MPVETARDGVQILGDRRVEAHRVLRARPHHELLHINIGRVQQTPPFGRRKHGNRVGGSRRAQVRALEGINGDVDLGVANGSWATDVLRMDHADLFADVEHRRLVTLALADDDRAVDRHGIHHTAHRFDGDLVRLVPVTLPHGMRAGNGGLLDDTQELE